MEHTVNEDFLSKGKMKDIGRWYVTRFVKGVAQELSEGASILDAGAGECAYRNFFSHCEYKAIDLAVGEHRWNYANLDYIAPLHQMPIEDCRFDAVLCTQVLEHLEWPRESVAEMYRVLRPGGRLYMTAPMAHGEHQIPHDFFRYTSFGLRSICTHAGFGQISITPFGGFWVRWAYEVPKGLSIFPRTRIRSANPNPIGIALFPFKVVALAVVRLLQLMFLYFDRFDKNKNDPFGWACVATK